MNDHANASLPSAGVEPERNTVRIFQSHNSAGLPAVAEFVEVIHHRTANTLGSDAMDFLRPLNLTQTQHPGVFLYSDPVRGRGWLRLERFRRPDAERIQELVRMEEITRVVGQEPLRPADLSFGNAMVMRTNNPWVTFAVAAVSIVLGFATLSSLFTVSTSTAGVVALFVVGILLVLAGIGVAIQGAIRLPWWRRARQHAREQGGTMPPDLTGL